MFAKRERPKYQVMLEGEIERAIRDLNTHPTGSDGYVTTLAYVERLSQMIEDEKISRVSKDALVNAGASLLGILMVIRHEDVNVIASKALGFVIRAK